MILTLGADRAGVVLAVIAEGVVDFEQIRTHVLEERASGALAHRELIDARRATPALTTADVRAVVELVRDVAHGAAFGPTAVVVSSDVAYGMLRMLEAFVEDVASVRPFRDYQHALEWLSTAAPIDNARSS